MERQSEVRKSAHSLPLTDDADTICCTHAMLNRICTCFNHACGIGCWGGRRPQTHRRPPAIKACLEHNLQGKVSVTWIWKPFGRMLESCFGVYGTNCSRASKCHRAPWVSIHFTGFGPRTHTRDSQQLAMLRILHVCLGVEVTACYKPRQQTPFIH